MYKSLNYGIIEIIIAIFWEGYTMARKSRKNIMVQVERDASREYTS